VLHCKAFRRLKQKTQVFLSPEGDLYRTRLTHTLEVSQIARTIARALRLNEDLTEAISLAHDLGHTPFGHAGERALDKLTPGGFKHYMQSLRVVDKLEKDGQGLNLTWEVRNGIVTHTKGTWAATPEGRIVRMADQIAYVNHDIEDAVRAGVLDPATLPKDCTAVLGQTKSARITTMINSILAHSDGDVAVGAEENEAFLALRDFMYATVYVDKTAKAEEQKVEITKVLF
jgi:dGTPase